VIFAGILLSITISGQKGLKLSNIPKQDRIPLNVFWSSFTSALRSDNKNKLSTLIQFPFTYDQCILDTSNRKDLLYTKVTRKQFDLNLYKIFFVPKFIQLINNCKYSDDIFEPVADTDTSREYKNHAYSFGYMTVEPTKQQNGHQEWFLINKINGQYKIISVESFDVKMKSLSPL
jgi:hypothetical protein